MSRTALLPSMLVAAVITLPGVAYANLLVNGDFEASSSAVATPPGWTNVGHSDGVINYSVFATPAYDGSFFYDLGGFGNASGPVGDGIQQTVATTPGATYRLVFGLSSENVDGTTELRVSIDGSTSSYTLTVDPSYGSLAKPFTTITIDGYVAAGLTTTISFIETLNTSGGNNDPMIDRVIFEASTPAPAPEPASLALVGVGLLTLARFRRRRG